MNIWAIRGATTITCDSRDEIISATKDLLNELLLKNEIKPEEIISIIFTVTPDIKAEFPAVAARLLGLATTPLICAQEIAKVDALSLCIRVLIHFYTERAKEELKPVYLRGAKQLRPDLETF